MIKEKVLVQKLIVYKKTVNKIFTKKKAIERNDNS